MQTTTIDLRPQVKHYEANGRQKLSDVYFRIDIPAYVRALNDYSKEACDADEKAVAAFDREVVDILLKDGWTLRHEVYGPYACPQLKKGAQYLYCHPQAISGLVLEEDIPHLEQLFQSMQSCKYRWTDNYGYIIVTASEEDERQLYRDFYPAGLAKTLQSLLTTKRKNLYKRKNEALHAAADRLVIQNRRIDLDEIGCGSPHMRTALWELIESEYDRLKNLGYIREGGGSGYQLLSRWANKAELREIEKRMKS